LRVNGLLEEPVSVDALVQDDQVHRDVYVDPRVFQLEMQRLWSRAWLYVGHESQVPAAGDYLTTTLATEPVILVRCQDGALAVLRNRCAHKGARLVSQRSGNAGGFFRCPYHAWAYDLDGALRAVPLRKGYDGTGMMAGPAGQGLVPVGGLAVYRGFVFARLAPSGASFADHVGDMAAVLDNLADRSPDGRLVVAGGCLRSSFRANWKIYLENINDTVHPVSTHQSVAESATAVWAGQPADAPRPMSMQQMLPFASGYQFFEQMGGRVLPNGHSVLGTRFSIHTGYEDMPGYRAAMDTAYGAERAAAILGFSPQNAVFYPGLAAKGSPQILRVLRPVAVDRTELEVWAFQPQAAPDMLLQRSVMYNRLVFSPMSVLSHDDVCLFESIQRSLRCAGNDWVSLHRNHDPAEASQPVLDVGGTNEILIRNQFRAWRTMMSNPAT
jgi:nitrite reductase/ring-hydroxylating ferredoxin subunit